MAPEGFRRRRGFAGIVAARPDALCRAAPAVAQGFATSSLIGAMPLAIASAPGLSRCSRWPSFARIMRDGKAASRTRGCADRQPRALVDEYEALLSGTREVTVLWTEKAEGAKFLGQASVMLPPGRRPEAILDFTPGCRSEAGGNSRRARSAEGARARGST